jgi:hypothetical protein
MWLSRYISQLQGWGIFDVNVFQIPRGSNFFFLTPRSDGGQINHSDKKVLLRVRCCHSRRNTKSVRVTGVRWISIYRESWNRQTRPWVH